MIPVPEVVELRHLPVEFLTFEALAHSCPPCAPRTPAAGLGWGLLMRFKILMADQRQEVQLARMCYDRLYAHQRIAAAHACGEEGLRQIALDLFHVYHRREGAGPGSRGAH